MSIQSCALAAAYKLTGDQRYADHAVAHWRAWFVDERTRMNPSLQYAQAIKGVSTGRGIGIIDTLGRSFAIEVMRLFAGPQTARTAGPALASMLIYILMAAVLSIRPAGLFGRRR